MSGGTAFPHELFGGPGYLPDPTWPDSAPKHVCQCGHLHPGARSLKADEDWLDVYGDSPLEQVSRGISEAGLWHCTTEDVDWLQAILNLTDGDVRAAKVLCYRVAYGLHFEPAAHFFNWQPLTPEVRRTYGVAGIKIPNKDALRRHVYLAIKKLVEGQDGQETKEQK